MFSVVVPLWNKRHTIAATVASALGQTYPDFDMVIVDDGASDGSLEALNGFSDPRIRIISQSRGGPGAARNAGIEASRGDWIAFLDADDIWLPDHLAELDRIRLAYPDAGLIGTSFASSARPERLPRPPVATRKIETINFFERAATTGRLLCSSSAAIPRSTYLELGGFGPAPWGQDTEYWVRIALARPVAVSNQVTAIHRRATGGITDTVARRPLGHLHSIADIEPAVALLTALDPQIADPRMRDAIAAYVDSRFRGCVRKSAMTGDFAALRALPRISPGPTRATERLILALARLPRPLARAAYAAGLTLIPIARGLTGRLGGRV
jgi:hypothetical protein